MKKIIFICTQLEAGGAQTASLRIAEQLRKKGFPIINLFLYKKRNAFSTEQHIEVLLNRNIESKLDYLLIFTRLVKKLKKESPDALICFTHYANVLGNFAGFLTGVKKRIASQRNPSQHFPWLARILDRLFGRIGVYTKIIMVSKAVNKSFDNYSKGYKEKSIVIPNGINIFDFSKSKSRIREELLGSVPIDSFVLVNVGRLADQKNQKVLIKMMSNLPDIHLFLIGEGERKEFLRKLSVQNNVQERIHFIGEVSHKEVLQYLKASDIFVMPSLFEGMSNSLLEAISFGLPVIASDIPPQREILTFNDNSLAGILVSPHDVVQWQNSVKELMTNKELREKLSEKAYARSKDFSFDKTIDLFQKELM